MSQPLPLSAAILAALAPFVSVSNVSADDSQPPVSVPPQTQAEFRQTLRQLIDLGVLSIDPRTGETRIRLDLLETLQREGRIDVRVAKEGGICPGV